MEMNAYIKIGLDCSQVRGRRGERKGKGIEEVKGDKSGRGRWGIDDAKRGSAQ